MKYNISPVVEFLPSTRNSRGNIEGKTLSSMPLDGVAVQGFRTELRADGVGDSAGQHHRQGELELIGRLQHHDNYCGQYGSHANNGHHSSAGFEPHGPIWAMT